MTTKILLALVLVGAVGCGGAKQAEVEQAPPTEGSVEAAAETHEAVTFHFEILRYGEVISKPQITTRPGPMQITADDVEFNLNYQAYDGGAKVWGEWVGGEITAVDGPFNTRVSLVNDPERGLELVVTAKKKR